MHWLFLFFYYWLAPVGTLRLDSFVDFLMVSSGVGCSSSGSCSAMLATDRFPAGWYRFDGSVYRSSMDIESTEIRPIHHRVTRRQKREEETRTNKTRDKHDNRIDSPTITEENWPPFRVCRLAWAIKRHWSFDSFFCHRWTNDLIAGLI